MRGEGGWRNKTIEPIRPLHPHQINMQNTCYTVVLYYYVAMLYICVCIMKSNGGLTDFVKCLLFCSLDSLCGIGRKQRERERERERSVRKRKRKRGKGEAVKVDTGNWKGMW